MRSALLVLTAIVVAAAGARVREESAGAESPAAHHATIPAQVVSGPASDSQRLLRAVEAVDVLQTSPDHGLDPAFYGAARLVDEINHVNSLATDAPERSQRVATLEARARQSLLAYAHDVALGRTSPSMVDGTWKARRKAPDFEASLNDVKTGRLAEWIEELQPHHPQYRALRRALRDLRAQQHQGGWPVIPSRKLEPWSWAPAVAVLRRRLEVSGELPHRDADTPELYDADVEDAVKVFQEHHAMKATGIADAATIAALNVSLDNRIRQLETNLERWRWMPDDLGARHFLVNIPAFLLMAREDGKIVRAIRVVVGKPGKETPIFSGDMDTVVFSPYWNVPDSIAEGETAPAVRQDPNYLARNQIDILRRTRSGARIVDADDVNWNDPDELKEISFRQRPGGRNALGRVKFLFPNRFNVYLHDTPSDSLFARPRRAFSHGCVRVEEPEALAAYVLRERPEWTAAKISAAMNAGVERYVKLDETIPVHIVYFTTWVDESGGLHFLPDVYGYDAKQMKH